MADMAMKDPYGNSLTMTGEHNMFTELNDLVPKNRDERSRIVEPGARYAESQMWPAAPYRVHLYPSQDYLGKKKLNPLHLHDPSAVTHEPNQYLDGSTDVGFNKQLAVIAKWVDLGTKKQPAQFFIEHAFEAMNGDVLFGREEAEYIKMLKEKHPDLDIHIED